MARLKYSTDGFERALMMAAVEVIAVVEGPSDVYFYEALLAAYSSNERQGTSYQVRTPREVRGAANGKQALLDIFRRLRSRGKLKMGEERIRYVLFFADKDYDDLGRRRLRSLHLIYTPGVCLENQLLDVGNLRESAEALVGRRFTDDALLAFSDLRLWKQRCALAWREWIEYCVACEVSGFAPRKNRSGPSPIHSGQPPVVNDPKLQQMKRQFSEGIGEAASAEFFAKSLSSVSRAIRSGKPDLVFCGKWYAYFLKAEVSALGEPYSALARRFTQDGALTSQLQRGMNFAGDVGRYFFRSIGQALSA